MPLMKTKHKLGLIFLVLALIVGVTGWYLSRHTIPVLQPAGMVGARERRLIIWCCVISAVIVIPVFGLLIAFAWRYREGNHRAKYRPDMDGNALVEGIWWLIPGAIIIVISVLIWNSSYALDPYKKLTANPEHIQVVALDGKWLFIYPKENIALTGFAWIPTHRSVEFDITSDTVMTSFWVPQLGSQMYAMPGMTTKLNLEADKTGSYHGLAANISGVHFADQTFTLFAKSQADFATWAKRSHTTDPAHELTLAAYNKLKQYNPDEPDAPWSSVEPGLYDTITMKYMMPMNGGNN